jgi:hypothetical protein
MVNNIFNEIGLANTFTIRVNSLGLKKEQLKYFDALREFYSNKNHFLTPETIKNIAD